MLVSFRPYLLDAAECDRLVTDLERLPIEPARVEGRVEGARQGLVSWFARSSGTEWLFDRIDGFARAMAANANIAVTRLDDPLQIGIYGPGSTFDWHLDTGDADTRFRKVTVSVQLSSPADYDGGELELVGHEPELYARMRGSAFAFASILGHRVTPVTRGRRISLVGWMEGPPYT